MLSRTDKTLIMAENCTQGNFDLKVSCKKSIRFKAGAELSSSVNKMDVDVIEELDDTQEVYHNAQFDSEAL